MRYLLGFMLTLLVILRLDASEDFIGVQNDLYEDYDNKSLIQKDSKHPNTPSFKGIPPNLAKKQNAKVDISTKKHGFIYSVVSLDVFFNNGILRQGYGVLVDGGYILTSKNLVYKNLSYSRSIKARMQDDSSDSIICIANLTPRFAFNDLALLEPESYTDIHCNKRSTSFYHERINLKYAISFQGDNKKTNKSINDKTLYLPFIGLDNKVAVKSLDKVSITSTPLKYSIPVFNKDSFLGLLIASNNTNVFFSKDKIKKFICKGYENKLLPLNELSRSCKY